MNSQTCENFEHRLRGLQGSEVTEGGKVKKKEWAFDLCDKKENAGKIWASF
jgi:hypothetical protein